MKRDLFGDFAKTTFSNNRCLGIKSGNEWMMGPYYTKLQNISPPHVSAFGGVGLLGNLVSIVVLLSKEMRKNCFNNILTALNITDSLHIVFAILEVLRVDFAKVLQDILKNQGQRLGQGVQLLPATLFLPLLPLPSLQDLPLCQHIPHHGR